MLAKSMYEINVHLGTACLKHSLHGIHTEAKLETHHFHKLLTTVFQSMKIFNANERSPSLMKKPTSNRISQKDYHGFLAFLFVLQLDSFNFLTQSANPSIELDSFLN